MTKLDRFLVVSIFAVLLVPLVIFGTNVEACCGVDVTDLVVSDEPDPLCVEATVTISGSYAAYSPWGPWTDLYDTGVEIKIFDSGSVLVAEFSQLLGEDEPDPGDYPPGTEWTFTQDWTPTVAGDYTYEVIAWSETNFGKMTTDIVSGTFTVKDSTCPTIDCLVEEEIRDLWVAECKACEDPELKNHGEYVHCRANIVSEYMEMGLVDEEGSSCLINPEARSDCGKKEK